MLAATLAAGSGADRPRAPEPGQPPMVAGQRVTEADYTLAFPGPAATDSHLPRGADDSGYWSYVAKKEGTAYSLRIDQFPASIHAPTPTARMYELLLHSYAAQSASRLQSTHIVQMGVRWGLEGVFVGAAGETEFRQVLIVGRRVFQVSYRSDPGVDATGAGRAFLESFKIAAG